MLWLVFYAPRVNRLPAEKIIFLKKGYLPPEQVSMYITTLFYEYGK
jgi:hypothetical protein